jgi:hypothetical protein
MADIQKPGDCASRWSHDSRVRTEAIARFMWLGVLSSRSPAEPRTFREPLPRTSLRDMRRAATSVLRLGGVGRDTDAEPLLCVGEMCC